MGVSYWETKQREKAVELTQHGISLMEDAVKQGTLDRSALVVPYNNISAMHRQLGSIAKADTLSGNGRQDQRQQSEISRYFQTNNYC